MAAQPSRAHPQETPEAGAAAAAGAASETGRPALRDRPRSFAFPPRLVRKYFEASDGTRLAYYETGPRDGVPVVISAGLGGGVRAWSAVIERLDEHCRLYAWDYRGLYASHPPPDPRHIGVEHHASDLDDLMTHLGLTGAVLAGWSMGVQVNFEWFRIRPSRPVAGLVCVHGTSGRIFETAFDGAPFTGAFASVAPTIFQAMRRFGGGLRRPLDRLARSRRVAEGFMAFGRRVGVMDGALDPDLFHDMARDWVKLDLERYADVFERLGAHDASDLLPLIDVPALIVSGGRDKMTPKHRSDVLLRHLPRAEGFTLPDATHFGLLEYPDAIATRILTFLRGL